MLGFSPRQIPSANTDAPALLEEIHPPILAPLESVEEVELSVKHMPPGASVEHIELTGSDLSFSIDIPMVTTQNVRQDSMTREHWIEQSVESPTPGEYRLKVHNDNAEFANYVGSKLEQSRPERTPKDFFVAIRGMTLEVAGLYGEPLNKSDTSSAALRYESLRKLPEIQDGQPVRISRGGSSPVLKSYVKSRIHSLLSDPFKDAEMRLMGVRVVNGDRCAVFAVIPIDTRVGAAPYPIRGELQVALRLEDGAEAELWFDGVIGPTVSQTGLGFVGSRRMRYHATSFFRRAR